MDEADDPGADSAKSKELKVAKAIAVAQLKIAKEQERIQKLTVMQQKAKESQSEETIMSKKYLNTKEGTLEEAVLNVWQDAAEEVGRLNLKQEGFSSSLIKKAIEIAKKHQDQMTIATKKIEKLKRGLSDDPEVKAALQHYNEQKEDAVSKVDGRTKQYKETLRRIKLRHERMRAKTKSAVTEETLEEANITVYLDAHDPAWMKKAMKKYGVKGKIHKKDVNPGYDSWKVTGDPKKLYKLYTDDEYGGDESFDDFIDMHKESIHELYSVEFTFKSDRDAKAAAAFVKKHATPGKVETEINGKAVEFYLGGSDDKELKQVKAEVEQKFKSKIADTKIQNEETIRTEGSKEEYQKFFNAALKKFGAKSPADMDDEKKKKFFDYIDKNWTKEEQQEFSEGELPPALKKAIDAKRKKKNGEKEDEDKDPVGKKQEIKEGTWAIPKNQKGYDKFMKLMQKPIPAGGADKKYFNTIGDDDVWDEVEKILDKKGPKADIRPAFRDFFNDVRIVKYMQDKGIKLHKHKKDYDGRWVIESITDEISEVAAVDYTFTDNRGAKAANSFARLWAPSARRGDDYDEDEFETEIFGSKKNQLSVDSGEDGDMEKLHNAIMKRYAKQITDHEVVAESRFIHEAKSPIDELKKIVSKKTAGKVSGMKVDLFSASAMVTVYNALNDQNQAKVEQMLKTKQGVLTFAEFAMSNVK